MRPRFGHVLLLAAITGFTASVRAADLPSGYIVVERVGTGSAVLGTASTATFLESFKPDGTPGSTVTLPTGTNPITASGTATSEGQITRSSNGLYLTVSGYSVVPGGNSDVANSTSSTVSRAVLTVDGVGAVGNYRTSTTFFSGNSIRSATFDGTNTFAVGGSTGVGLYNASSGNSTVVSSTVANNRVVSIQNGQLYFSTQSGTRGIYSVGSGVPTSSGQTATNLFDTGSSSNPNAFQFNSAGNVVYIADESPLASGGGIQKWTLSGSTWSLAYTLGTGSGSTLGVRGLTVDWSNPNAPVLYATTTETSANRIVKITDTGSGSAASTFATAGSNTAYRGVDISLLPAVYTNPSNGSFNTSANWSLNVNSADRNGINLLFQNVNTGSGGSTATVNNNQTNLTSVSSIVFRNTANGYGTGAFTQYTLTGNGLTLNGNPTTNVEVTGNAGQRLAGVYNSSGVTQTVNLPLTISGSQRFIAESGDLNFGGAITLGTATTPGNLTVAGPFSNTTPTTVTINGAIGSANAPNSLTKSGIGTLALNGTNTFTGTTTVSGGTLRGDGSLTGTLLVNPGGTVRGGSSANPTGTFTVNNTVKIVGAPSGGGALAVDLNNTNTSGTTASRLVIAGSGNALNFDTATTSGPVVIALLNDVYLTNGTPYSYTIVNGVANGYQLNGTGVTAYTYGSGGDFVLSSANFTAFNNVTLAVSGNDLVLTFTPVPEPGAVLGIAAAGLGLVALGRRVRTRWVRG